MSDVPAQIPARSRLAEFASDIKLSHSIFALPFALLSMFLATNATGNRFPSAIQIVLILLCMVLARSFGMGMNRLLDASLDAKNPRTARRSIPAGRLSRGTAVSILVGCATGFQIVTIGFGLFERNWLPAVLALPVLALLGAYPFFKRFTRWCHFYLGFCLALAPVCAWVAIAGTLSVIPFLMAGAVLCWTAGFDILYATQDVESDLQTGVYSVPAAFGVASSLWIARITHLVCLAMLITLGVVSVPLDWLWFIAVAIVACIFVFEHAIVKPSDLSRINLAFFTLNGIVSVCLGTLGIVDVLVQ
jgi:4-hydroxybenzoate polyprenyltransferase